MISIQIHLDALRERIDTVTRLLDETHPRAVAGSPARVGPISREARGLAVVLLFAAYEDLLKSLTRTLLEGAIGVRVSNKRLRPGLRAFAMASAARSVRDLSAKKLYTHGLPGLVDASNPGGRICTLDANSFPDDGSFMKQSQVTVWCGLFDVVDPHLILSRIWVKIDTIVAERNAVAHGRSTAEDVGRGYTEAEMRQLVAEWHADWMNFLVVVGARASSRDFFRVP